MRSPNPPSSPPLSKTTAEEEQRDASLANVDERGDDEDADTEEEKIFVPRKYDVLFGRGRPLQDHPGNLRFHRIINRARASYLSSRKEDKFGVSSDIMHEIRTRKENPESKDNPKKESDGDDDTNSPSSGGEPARFLKKVSDANAPTDQVYWVEVSDDLAVEKISHALRGRPRSETRNRSDSSGSGKNVGSGRGRRGSKSNEYEPSDVTGKRKGPPSPPSNETQSDIAVGTNDADAVFQFNANTSTHVPTSSYTSESQNVGNQSLDNNQIQSIAAALIFQKIQQEIAQQQLLQQSLLQQSLRQQPVNPQQTTTASGVNAISALNPSGQNQAAQLSSGMVVGLPVQQLQLLLQQQQQQQAMQLGQQQSLQHQQAIQYLLQQNQLQAQPPQESQSEQEQKPPTAQQPEQPNLSTTSSSPGLATPAPQTNTGRGTVIDPISTILEASGINTSNPNVLSSSYPNMIAQQPPGVPPQNLPTMIPQPAGGGVAAASDLQGDQQFQQLQQFFLEILQSHLALLAALNPQQPLQPQSFATIPSLSSSTTVPAPQLGIGQLPQHFLQILQSPQALLAALNLQQPSLPQNLTTAPNASSSTTDAPQNQPQQPGKKAPPSNKPP